MMISYLNLKNIKLLLNKKKVLIIIKIQELVKDKELRKYLQEDPQLSVSHFMPVQPIN